MEKIKLTPRSKEIFRLMFEGNYMDTYTPDDDGALTLLENEGLIILNTNNDGVTNAFPSNRGFAYYHVYPELKDPTIFDDKKYLITTIIAVAALIISIISLFK